MKKWMTALALVMAFSLAGCGSQVNDDLNRTGTDQNDQVSNSTAAGDAYYEADRAGEVEPDGTYNDQTATNGESGMAQGTKNVVDGAADAVEDVTDGIVNGTERVVDGVINGVDNARYRPITGQHRAEAGKSPGFRPASLKGTPGKAGHLYSCPAYSPYRRASMGGFFAALLAG